MQILNRVKTLLSKGNRGTEAVESNSAIFNIMAQEKIQKIMNQLTAKGSVTDVMNIIQLRYRNIGPEAAQMVFEINEQISDEDLRQLISLPFEITISELAGKLILITGFESHTNLGGAPMFMSKMILHTHPESDPKGSPWPSYVDIFKTEGLNAGSFVVTRKGIIKYGYPKIDPTTNKGIGNVDIRDVISKWFAKNGLDSVTDISEATEKIEEFITKSGSLISFYEWDDTGEAALKVKEELLAEINSVFK